MRPNSHTVEGPETVYAPINGNLEQACSCYVQHELASRGNINTREDTKERRKTRTVKWPPVYCQLIVASKRQIAIQPMYVSLIATVNGTPSWDSSA